MNILSKLGLFSLLSVSIMSNSFANDNIDFSKINNVQKEQLNKLIENYLLNNPEILIKMSDKIQEKQLIESNKKIIAVKDELINNKNDPKIINKDSKITLIEFFDYNCVYCLKMSKDLEEVIQKNNNVNYVFKEFPIFAGSNDTSLLSAIYGNKIYKEKGSVAYMTYHNNVFGTPRDKQNHNVIDNSSFNKILLDMGYKDPLSKDEKEMYTDVIQKNMELGQKLGIQGTPAIIIIPNKDPKPEDVILKVGLTSPKELNDIINYLNNKL